MNDDIAPWNNPELPLFNPALVWTDGWGRISADVLPGPDAAKVAAKAIHAKAGAAVAIHSTCGRTPGRVTFREAD